MQKRLDEGRAVYDLEQDGKEENVVGAHCTPEAPEDDSGRPGPARLLQSAGHGPLDGMVSDCMGTYIDDISGEVLPPGLTHDAWVEDIKFMQGWHAGTLCRCQLAKQ